ncbi:MAG: homoserine kinase [Actinobacteria bacterium]|nr:homoserine kinase [Acidimicrobiia bacterium]NCX79193.1 homoserine kinase [Actinomycetota bacterium]NCZ67280.1 homoserine kinase [Acidimicrobiia bacterium]NDF23209.1 homoserine kinase [Actinomycetota bacterium]
MIRVSVPASTANLGAGFDSLGLALSLHLEAGLVHDGQPSTVRVCDAHHPTHVAFRRAGGVGEVWSSGGIPMGRGLGFSGAARVAGALLAIAQRDSVVVANSHDGRLSAFRTAAELEGHPDNAASSALGGFTVAAADRAIRVPVAVYGDVVVWVPENTTSTKESRTKLSQTVSLADAVWNISRSSLLVAALATGDVAALHDATQDRLHQDVRLAMVPDTKRAMRAALDAGAWAAWLSGSGPTMACLCEPSRVDTIAMALPRSGQVHRLRIDMSGPVVS